MMRTAYFRPLAVAVLAVGFLAAAGPSTAQEASGLEARIEVLEAREAIRELIYAYGRALDTRNFKAFAELFEAEQGTWVGGFGSATGREAIFALMDGSLGHAEEAIAPRSHHVFGNIVISVDGDRASARTQWSFIVPSDSGDPRWMYLGHYDDQFIRRDGSWFFLRREAFTDIPIPQAGG